MRERWSEYIRSRRELWRQLYGRAASIHAPLESEPSARLSALAERFHRRGDVRFLAAVHYMGDARTARFFTQELGGLLRSASRSTLRSQEPQRGSIRGRVAWSHTFVERATGRLDYASFVLNKTASSWDLPENQLLKLFLTQVDELLSGVLSHKEFEEFWPQWAGIHVLIRQSLKERWLSRVTLPRAASPVMRARALRAREPRYKSVSLLQRELDRTLLSGKWEAMLALIGRGWFEPTAEDDLFELYTLVKVLECLSALYGPPQSLAVIRSGRSDVARFVAADGAIVKVFFDHSPTAAIGFTSEYLEIFSRYAGIVARPRRPDMIIATFRDNVLTKVTLVECKKTDDDGYVRDSAYKALGYLCDFAANWPDGEAKPKAVVVYPHSIEVIRENDGRGQDVWLMGADDEVRWAEALSS